MQDDPADRFAKANRVSIRALLVSDQGVDVRAALAKAGIFDPVAIPVLLGDQPNLSHGILGDGVTPNLTGVLEPDQPDHSSAKPASNRAEVRKQGSRTRHQRPTTANLPAAFGLKPFAPVRKRPA